MKVFSEGADGYREPLWQMTDMPIEANGEWWKGQVQINDHQVIEAWKTSRPQNF